MANVFTPITDSYAIPRAQAIFKVNGREAFQNLGDMESLGLTPEIEETSRRSKEFWPPREVASDPIFIGASGSASLVSQTDLVRGMLYMSDDRTYVAQSAIAAGTRSITGVEVGIYDLGALDVTVTGVTDGTTLVDYVEGTHYKVDRRTGFLEILAIPASADTDLEIEFTAPEITESAKRQELTVFGTTGIRGELFVRGIGGRGEQIEMRLWDVEIRPSGDIQLQGDDDYQQVEVSIKVYADGTKQTGYELGQVRVIPAGQPT